MLFMPADGLSVPMSFASVIHDLFLSAIANGHSDLDWSALALVAAQNAGIAGAKSGDLAKQGLTAVPALVSYHCAGSAAAGMHFAMRIAAQLLDLKQSMA
jgi:hypothetical protein